MAVSTASLSSSAAEPRNLWLHTRHFDLRFVTLSVVLVAGPYLAYLLLLNMGALLAPLTSALGTTTDDLSRNFVNASVALLVGGPHMYATWTRTGLDRDFAAKHRRFLLAGLIIPVIVTTLALFNLPLLLTIFFFWASIHVLHQIIFITSMYNQRQKSGQQFNLSLFSRLSDYAVILTALYPLAAWKIANNSFAIGQNNLSEMVNQVLGIVGLSTGPWMWLLAGGAFAIALTVWIAKSLAEYRQGTLHKPKTLFIGVTVTASFFVPALGNLDTAFQGMNVWHSFQYLALTWMLIHIRSQRGGLKNSPFVEKMAVDNKAAKRYYAFNIGLTVADVGLALVIFLVLWQVVGFSFDAAFDRGYYIAVLSFLWMHYYQDHFLFVHPEAIEGKSLA
jgi:hypothetical protein